MTNFKIGDEIIVTASGEGYSTYRSWFTDREHREAFSYGFLAPVGTQGVIVEIGNNEFDDKRIIGFMSENRTYIIGQSGAELVINNSLINDDHEIITIALNNFLVKLGIDFINGDINIDEYTTNAVKIKTALQNIKA